MSHVDNNPVLSLSSAALVAYRKATNGSHPDGSTLDRIAGLLAEGKRVRTCASVDCCDPRTLTADEVSRGRFENGATRISFRDGRDSLTNLCIPFEELPRAIDQVTSAYRRASSLADVNAPFMRPCPFCDSGPALIEIDARTWAVVCSNCNVIGPHPDSDQDRVTAILRWNRSLGGAPPIREARAATDWEKVAMMIAGFASLAMLGTAVYLSS